jgi:MFS transporter, DHA2 family, multidrug resistance protein
LGNHLAGMNYKNLGMFLIILFGFVLNVISMQVVGSSIRNLQGALNIGLDQVSYVMSAYLMAEVVIIPFAGWLSRLLSIKLLFLIGLTGFLIACIGAASTNNFYILVGFRAMQGFFGGALMPLMFSCIYLLFTPKQLPFALSLTATVGVSSIAFGPAIGGYMTEMISWRWMFLYNLPIGVVLLVLAYIFIDLDKKEKHLSKQIDYYGIVLLALGLLLLLITLQEGSRLDWFASSTIRICSILSFTCMLLFFIREFTAKYPIIDLTIFLDRNFSIGCINVIVFGISIYAPIFLLPVFLGEVKGLGPWDIGVIVSVMGLSWMGIGPFVGILLNVLGARLIIFIGCVLTIIGTWLLLNMTPEFGFKELFWPQVLRGIGSQLLWIGNQYIAMLFVTKNGIQNAASVFNLILRLGGAISIATTNIFLEKLRVMYYGGISNMLINGPQIISGFTQKMEGLFKTLPMFSSLNPEYKTILAMELLGLREGFVMAVNNITFVILWVAFIPIILLPFCKMKNLEKY